MLHISLADGAIKSFAEPVSVNQLACSISPSLAKKTIAALVDGQPVDTGYVIHHDAHVYLITVENQQALDIIRRSVNYLLAYAVKILYPESQLASATSTTDGFHYDFAYHRTLTPNDLSLIENKMQELVTQKQAITAVHWEKNKVISHFQAKHEPYKIALIEESADLNFICYQTNEHQFIDYLAGPIVPNTSYLNAFKLMNVSGAYWRGDKNNEMLQRIDGTAWLDKIELKNYLQRLAEAEKRDHRRIGKELDLFHIQEEAPGMIFWHAKGWRIWQSIEQYVRQALLKSGYEEVKTPIMMDKSLWERSGHWDNYQEHMFTTQSEKKTYAIKPMNCPMHVEIFKHRIHSYRDLPLRLAEFGSCHRNEPSGALHGLMRVRGFVQDDAHIFCTEEQIENEVTQFHQLLVDMYKVFGFNDLEVKLSLRPEKKAGDDSTWDRAEEGLRRALSSCGVHWEELPGEGAFYGPKVEYHIKDAIGRSWQCGTIQLDFVLPARLGAEYVTEHNEKAIPVILHRAVLGSFERFIAILIEHYAGQFPLWLSPIQAVVLNITEKQADHCRQLASQLNAAGICCTIDVRNEKIGFKIREQHLQKIPYLLVIGEKEVQNGNISVRHRQQNLGMMSEQQLIDKLKEEIHLFH